MAKLRDVGIDPAKTFTSQFFYGSHRAAVEAVLHETADITAVSSHQTDPASMEEKLRWYAGPAAAEKLAPITFTESCLNDAIVLPASLGKAMAARIAQKLATPVQGPVPSSRFLAALEAEGLVETPLAEYHRLAPLLTPPSGEGERITLTPPSRSSRTSWH
jgi:ABC-type phosphate/phosphonate transport system substrate-binding protein